MSDRPELSKELDGKTFLNYYYLKEELTGFCKTAGLPSSGGKMELTERIARYLETGEVVSPNTESKVKGKTGDLTEATVIEENIVCSEKHRAFFKRMIGESFSFQVAFQKWLKSNAGKTYGQAIQAYYEIIELKKKQKTAIDPQFEYNTYIRDFFADNPKQGLEEAIKCWKFKKSRPGHNRYEKVDLIALE